MNTCLPRLACFAAVLTVAARLSAVDVPAESPATTRAAFLKIIARPAVPLAPAFDPPSARDGLLQIAFSYAADSEQRVPAILVKPSDHATITSANLLAGRVRRPVVISLHGTGGNKEGQVTLLSQFATAGFVAVAIDGRYHGARAKTPKGSANYAAAILRAYRAEEPHEHPFYYDTVRDVMRLIDYLVTRDDVDPARIGIIGFSKGGTEAYLSAAADPRIAATVACIGVQSFRWALENNSWQSRIGTVQTAFDAAAQDAGVATPDAAFVRRFYDRVMPGVYGQFDGPAMLPLIAPRPLLAINGDSDPRTPVPGLNLCADSARAAYRAAGAEGNFTLTIQPKTGHKVNPESLIAARAWLAKHLKP